MKAKIDQNLCVGCGICSDICPEAFEAAGAVAVVKAGEVPLTAEKYCRQAKDDCPVEAITIEE